MKNYPLVFVVEDDSAVREVVCELLESADIASQGFGSGSEFLETVEPLPGQTCS